MLGIALTDIQDDAIPFGILWRVKDTQIRRGTIAEVLPEGNITILATREPRFGFGFKFFWLEILRACERLYAATRPVIDLNRPAEFLNNFAC